MDDSIRDKWFAVWHPLHLGFTADGHANAIGLSLGVFWVRHRGGHNLYRWSGNAEPVQTDRIVGTAAARATTVKTFPWITHEADTTYWYLLRTVGPGGVEETTTHQLRRVSFDASGAYLGQRPNPPERLRINCLFDGRFGLSWSYDPAGQEAPPSVFEVYNDAASPGTVDYATSVDSVPFEPGGVLYSWTSEPFADGTRVAWAVRARSAGGVLEENVVRLAAEADATGPAIHNDIASELSADEP